jgi:hypothetical protein
VRHVLIAVGEVEAVGFAPGGAAGQLDGGATTVRGDGLDRGQQAPADAAPALPGVDHQGGDPAAAAALVEERDHVEARHSHNQSTGLGDQHRVGRAAGQLGDAPAQLACRRWISQLAEERGERGLIVRSGRADADGRAGRRRGARRAADAGHGAAPTVVARRAGAVTTGAGRPA